MANVNDFSKVLDDLKNRFGSRFIFSFTIAWLIYNWQITIALFWYDKTQFQAEGCRSIFDFIKHQLEINSNSSKTLFTALIYTFGLPVSKGLINIWDELILYLRDFTKTYFSLNQDAKIIKDLKFDIKSISDVTFLDGDWDCKFGFKGVSGWVSDEQIIITKDIWYVIERRSGKRTEKYKIVDFYLNYYDQKLLFTVKEPDIATKHILTFENVQKHTNTLQGKFNNNEDVYLSRISKPINEMNKQNIFSKFQNLFKNRNALKTPNQ
jgi:hypothetical protein